MNAETENFDIERFYTRMSKRYLRENSRDAIRRHARMVQRARAEGPGLEALPTGNPRVFTVTVCARDRTGLFARIAGAITFHRMNILEARAYTTPQGMALDLFTVCLPLSTLFAPFDWDLLRETLVRTLAGRLDLPEALFERLRQEPRQNLVPDTDLPRVDVERDPLRRFTVFEVMAADEPGLLFRMCHCLARSHVVIVEAEIRTIGFRVRDRFLIRGMDGRPLKGERLEGLVRQKLLEELKDPVWRKSG